VLGRQRIPLGKARLWNPTDLFNAISPLAIQGDQRIGQDAVRAKLRLAEGLWSEAIWSPQDDPDEHRGALRLEFGRTSVDASAFVGRFGLDWVFGGDFATNLGDAAVRGEATFTNLRRGDTLWQVVGSIDYQAPVGTGIYLLAEHLYNENTVSAVPLSSIPAFPVVEVGLNALVTGNPNIDRITSIAKHQTGLQAGYDLTPLLRANALAIWDWNDHSVALFPVLGWSPRDDLELSVGAQFFVGQAGSQYGDATTLLFWQLDLFF